MKNIYERILKNAGLSCNEPYKIKLLLKIIGGDDFVEVEGWRDFFLIDSNPKKQELLSLKARIKYIIEGILHEFDILEYSQTNDTATLKICLKPNQDIDFPTQDYIKLLFDDDFWPDTWGEGDISLGYEGEGDLPTDVYELTPVLLSVEKIQTTR